MPRAEVLSMTKTILVMLALLLFVSACDGGMPPMRPTPKTTVDAETKPSAPSNASDTAPTTRPKAPVGRAPTIIARANGAKKAAIDAANKAGNDAIAAAREWADCRFDDCDKLGHQAIGESSNAAFRVGVLAGLAVNHVTELLLYVEQFGVNEGYVVAREKRVDRAVELAAEASDAADRFIADRKDQIQKASEEKAQIDAASSACDANPASCPTKCKGGDKAACVLVATKAWRSKPPKFDEAKKLMKASCDAGFASACLVMPQLEKDAAAWNGETDSLWGEVVRIGDDVAQRKHIESFARSNLHGVRNARATERVRQHVAALISESYCPAKKAFLAHGTIADFGKRAADHCKTEPPTGTGLSGVDVTLTAECTATYATACP